jgi:hypothetical protein
VEDLSPSGCGAIEEKVRFFVAVVAGEDHRREISWSFAKLLKANVNKLQIEEVFSNASLVHLPRFTSRRGLP